ncbi:MAG: ABC transporter permease [Bacilli bacterium]|nr:ABC transporter permease [Bacilli bacterium]
MIVFNNYFKILKKYTSMIITYTLIFVAFAVFATANSSSVDSSTSFLATKPNVALINRDQETVLIESFKEYLEDNSNIKELKDDEESLRDALFYREVDYILIIPNNFTENFMASKKPKIDTMNIPDSYGMIYTEMLLNRYLNIAKVYVASGMEQTEISENIKIDLKESANIILSENADMNTSITINYFFNFFNYTFLIICVYIVGMVINSYKNINIRRRNLVSSFSYKKLNIQLFLGSFCLTLSIWLIYILISLILYPKSMFTNHGLLLIVNSFVFSITVLSIGFLIGNVVKSREATDGLANVLALGSSFICGAFVPQEFLGTTVLTFAKFLPSYWFIKNNNDIVKLTSYNYSSLQPIFMNVLIVLAFGIALFIINNVITKLRLKDS